MCACVKIINVLQRTCTLARKLVSCTQSVFSAKARGHCSANIRSKFNPCFSAKKKFKLGGDAFYHSRIILNNCWAILVQPAYKRSKWLARSSDPQINNRTNKRSNIQQMSRVGATALIISLFANIRHGKHGRQEIAGCSSNAIDCLSRTPRLDVQSRSFMFVCLSASILR